MLEAKEKVLEQIKIEKETFSKYHIKEIDSILFYTVDSLRLTSLGVRIMTQIFIPFVVDHLGLKAKHLIGLDNAMIFPYFLNKNKLIIFSESDAIMIKMGGLDHFLESRFTI